LLRRLAIFAGGFDLEAAEAACAGEGVERADVLDGVARLVDKSLVVAGEREGQVRYRLLEPIRQYALACLEASGNAESMRARHAAHFLGLAEQVELQRWHGANFDWLDRLERESDNLRAALGWAEASANAELS